MHADLPLHDTVAPVRVPGNELGGGLFAGHAGGALKIHVVGLEHVKARNAAHHAGLHQLLRQVALLDEVVVQHQHLQILGGGDQPAAIGGDTLAAQHTLGLQRQLVGVGFGRGGLGGADGSAGRALQRIDALLIHGQAHAVTGAVQALGHNAVGHAGGVVAVDQLVHGLVLVDRQVNIGRAARVQVNAGGLVVGLYGNLGVTHRDFNFACLGVALVAVVENHIVAGHKHIAQLGVHQLAPAFLIQMCHIKLPLFPVSVFVF